MTGFPSIGAVLLLLALPLQERSNRSDRTEQQAPPPVPAAPEPASSAEAKPRYKIQCTLVDVEEETDASELAIRLYHPHGGVGGQPRETWHSFTKLSCAECHDMDAKTDLASNDFWKAIIDNQETLQTWATDSEDVSVLARPALLVEAGRVAMIDAESEQQLDYFHRRKDGLFELRSEPFKTGISIRATVNTVAGGKGQVRLDPLSVSVTAIKSREKIEGADLPYVGRPVLTTTSIETSLIAKLGQSAVISIDSPRGGRVLISVKVSEVSPGEDEQQ